MQKSLFRWRMRFTLALICLLLAFNVVGIQAQDITPTPETPVASPEPTETTPPPPIPTEEPTETTPPPVIPTEEPTEVPTEVVTEVPTEVPTEVITEVPTEAVTETPVTETPVETPAPIAWSILAREQFNTADLSAWIPGAGWSVVISSPVDSNYPINAPDVDQALQVVNSNDAIQFGALAYGNVSVETSFLVTAGSAQVSIRQSATDPNANYTAAIDATGLVQLYRSGVAVVPPIQAAATTDNWHVLQLSANGSVVTLTVDKLQTVSWTDTEPLAAGFISLSGEFGDTATAVDPAANVVKADNFFVYVPDAEKVLYPTPTPATPVPTEAPTETPVEIVPTEEVTSPPTEPPTVSGKNLDAVPPPTEEQLIGALVSGNNDFPGFTITPAMLPYVDFGDTTAATLQTNETEPTCPNNIANTVWFSFTPTTTASYTISTAGSNFDTILAVYTGAAVDSLTPAVAAPAVSCNDDASTSVLTSQLSISLTAGTTYRIQVGGYNGRFGTYYMRVQQGTIAAATAPVLVSPATATVLNDSTPDLDWNPSTTNGFTYDVQIATAASFAPASLIATYPASVATNLTVPVALIPGTYYWRVRAYNVNGLLGGTSAVRNFVYRTTPPVQTLPAANANLTDSTPTFTWVTYGAGAVYTLQIDADNDFSSGALTIPVTGVTHTPTSPLAPGDWYWRVKADPVIGDETDYSAPARKFTINILGAPANNFVTPDTTPAFSWLAATGPAPATEYRVEIDDDPAFTSINHTSPDLTVLTYTLPTPFAANGGYGVYYWRVKISRDGGTTFLPASPIEPPFRKLFISPPMPAAPVLVAPAASAATIDTTPVLDWNDTVTLPANGGPFTYEVQVCTTAACTTIVDTDTTAAGVTQDVTDALAPGAYYWRVRTVNAFTVASPYSAARLFTVKTNILTTPLDNAATTDQTPAFAWAAVAYSSTVPAVPVKYHLYVYSDPGMGSGSLVFEKADLTAATYTMVAGDPPLAYGDYYWRVGVSTDGDPINDEFTSADSRKLNVTSTIPVAPTFPAVPPLNATLAATTPTLPWNAVTPPPGSGWTVASYDVQVSTVATFATLAQSDNVGAVPTQFTPTALLPGTYYWRVRAVNSYGAPGAFSAARKIIIRTLPPVLSAPAAGFVTIDTTPAFTWATFGIGAKYNIQIDDNTGFVSPLTNPSPLTTLTFTSPLLTQGVWYWRVQAIDANGATTAFSEYRTLYVRTQPALPAPTLLSPATGFITNPLPLLDWNAVVVPPPAGTPGLANYEVQIATNATFANIVQTGTPATDQYQVTAAGTAADGTYYWRVRAFNTAGIPGAFSVVRTFIRDTAVVAVLPSLTAPADTSSSTNKLPTFTWTKPVGSTKFAIRYSNNYPASYVPNTGFELNSVGTVIIQNLTVTSYKPPSPLLVGTYYWQVQAFDAAGNGSGWTNLRSFKINSAPGDTPIPNHYGPGDDILLTWGPLSWVNGAGGYYEVQVDNNSNFSSPEYQRVGAPSPTGGINNAEYVSGPYGIEVPDSSTPGGLPNGTWYWRVRGFNPTPAAFGAYSSTGTFTVEK